MSTFSSTTHPKVIEQFLTKEFGTDWLTWEPETLWSNLQTISGHHFDLTPEFKDKINAVRVLSASNAFWTEPTVFENVVEALDGDGINPDVVTPCLPEEITYAIVVAKSIRDEKFDDDVKAYINACFREAGVIAFPSVISELRDPHKDPEVEKLAKEVERSFSEYVDYKVDLQDPKWVQSAKLSDIISYVKEKLS